MSDVRKHLESAMAHTPTPGEDEEQAARVFYVAATSATHRLIMRMGRTGVFGQRLKKGDMNGKQCRTSSKLEFF